MAARPGSENPLSGPRLPGRLPIRQPEPNRNPCERDPSHTGGIRFELHRYGRRVGRIYLCGLCLRDLIVQPDPDPLFVDAA